MGREELHCREEEDRGEGGAENFGGKFFGDKCSGDEFSLIWVFFFF
jgi:hypothetical protein